MEDITTSTTGDVTGVSYYHIVERIPIVTHCPMCNGSGNDESIKGAVEKYSCPFCEGSGHIVRWPEIPVYTYTTSGNETVCWACKGTRDTGFRGGNDPISMARRICPICRGKKS
jgi:DnaJ-class molecular chaperone